METVLKAISDWIKSLLTAAIMSNLNGLFDDVNTQVGNIAQQVGTKPSNFEPRVFAMIEALSRNVVLPIAGVILTFIACYELIQLIRINRITISAGVSGLLLSFCSAAVSCIMPQKASFSKTFCHKLPDFT